MTIILTVSAAVIIEVTVDRKIACEPETEQEEDIGHDQVDYAIDKRIAAGSWAAVVVS